MGLKVLVVSRSISEQFPKGVVMGQQPGAGSQVRQGRQISVIVSEGVNIFTMPDLRFQSMREAGLQLSRLKLELGKTTLVPNDDVPANFVVAQDPPPLSSVREGTVVNFTLSKGPPSSIRVPNFVGLDVDEARDQATKAHVHLGQVVWTPFGPAGPPRGQVVRQMPGPGLLNEPFAPVSLQVSAGPLEYGRLVRQVHASVVVPRNDTGKAQRVRVQVRDETGTWNVYDSFTEPGQRLDFQVTAVGSATLETYVNNELLNQSTLGKEPPLTPPTPGPKDDKRSYPGMPVPGEKRGQ
jgi:serine/threonine-protein kinase